MTFFIISLLLAFLVGMLSTPLWGVLTFIGLYVLLALWALLIMVLAFFGLVAILAGEPTKIKT